MKQGDGAAVFVVVAVQGGTGVTAHDFTESKKAQHWASPLQAVQLTGEQISPGVHGVTTRFEAVLC